MSDGQMNVDVWRILKFNHGRANSAQKWIAQVMAEGYNVKSRATLVVPNGTVKKYTSGYLWKRPL